MSKTISHSSFCRRMTGKCSAFRLPTGSGWLFLALIFAAIAALPVLVIGGHFLMPAPGIWQHLAEHVLWDLIVNTSFLLAIVLPITAFIGVSLAWLTGACDYPGRRFFAWALLLPFAVPPYVFAFVYLGIFDFTGPVQSALRALFPGLGFIDIRGGMGVSLILSLSFYPYVYLMSRSAFMSQGRTLMDASRTLGLTPFQAFFRVVLPMARPFIAAGMILVAMETLADFGAVSIFNYDTFTTAVYKAWFGMFSLDSAAQLASIQVLFALSLIVLEQHYRRRMRYTSPGRNAQPARIELTGAPKWAAVIFSTTIFILAFGLMVGQLLIWVVDVAPEGLLRYLPFSRNSLFLAAGSALVTVLVALSLAYAKRQNDGRLMRWVTRCATLGYALPGTVLAVGVFLPASWLDRVIALLLFGEGHAAGPFIQGSLGLMVAAYAIRFLAAGFGATDSAMQRVSPSIGDAARTMGASGLRILTRIYVPMMQKGVLTCLLLVFVEVVREMPLTLMMRPFGWDTLAVKIYEYTSEGEWARAALPALILVFVGVGPVMLLTRQMEKRKK